MLTSNPDLRDGCLVLDGGGADVAVVGGKAAMLDRLIAAGAPVPPCAVVTAEVYRAAVGDSRVAELVHPLDGPTPDEPTCDRRAIDEAFAAVALPRGTDERIVDLAARIGRGRPVAVRSSATAEDQMTASFAGQYRTQLGVLPEDLPQAVRACWASLWYPAPVAYRRFRAIDDPVEMAVLIMPMLEPSEAGVLFTEDPTMPGSLRIEQVEGLGEALVSGAATPDAVSLDRARIAEADLAPNMRELVEIALDLERIVGTPLDVEWAVEHGKLHLLQARPITTGRDAFDDGFDTGDEQARYTTSGIAEMLPGVLEPRTWELNSWLVEESFRRLFDGLGADLAPLDRPHALIGRFRGRAALDLDQLERAVSTIPGGSVEELEHQYFGDILDPVDAPREIPPGSSQFRQAVRTLRARSCAYQRAELVIQAIELTLDAEPDLATLQDRDVLALRGRILHLAAMTMDAEVAVAATATASYRGLELFLRDQLDLEQAADALATLTAIDRSSHRGRRALRIDALAAHLATTPELTSIRETDDWTRAREMAAGTEAGRELIARFDALLRRAGSTSLFGGPTWDRVPELVWPMVRRLPLPEPVGDRSIPLAEVEARLAVVTRWRMADLRRRFLRREANDASTFLERREQTKASLLQLGGILWRIDRELGARLTAAGVLDTPDEVDVITGREIADALDGASTVTSHDIVRRRHRAASNRLEPPLGVVFRGRPVAPHPQRLIGDVVTGWSASPGRYEGRARVVETPSTTGLRRGDVIVARTTDSSWLPLFHLAGAIVVEAGGPLSHAAILARELGMPAVINVPGIVERVERERSPFLVVDGTTGQVAIRSVEASGATDPAMEARPRDRHPAGGLAPIERSESVATYDPDRRNVFVTGLIGVGALMSVAIGLTQAIGSARTQERIAQRQRPRAEALARGTVQGFAADRVGSAGLRRRGYYVWTSVLATAASLLAMWTVDDYYETSPTTGTFWWFTIGLVTSATMAVVALIGLRAAVAWPNVSAIARRGSLPQIHQQRTPGELIGRLPAMVVAALLFATAVLTYLVVEAESQLTEVDRRILDLVGGGSDDNWWYPDLFDRLLRKEIMVPLAVVLTIAARRCRPLLVTIPLVIAGGGMLHLSFQHFIERRRPDIGPKPNDLDSFPGGHVNEITIMLGLLPLVVYVAVQRHWVFRALDVLCGVVLAAGLADAVRISDHWPTDNLAGFMIGVAMVTIARGVASAPALHAGCHGCRAQCSTRTRDGPEASEEVST